MTRRCWIVNASPIIFLSHIKSLYLLNQLADEVVVPSSVRAEVLAGNNRIPGTAITVDFPDWVQVREDLPLSGDIAGWDLGAGESQVLAHAVASGSEAVLDDLQGRSCARALGVPTTGTLGVILRAKKLGLIPAARPLITELLQKGLYLSRSLAEQTLSEVGE